MSTKRIVVDASVALKWRLKDEEATAQADALLDDFLSGSLALLAPTLFDYEIANALYVAVIRDRLTEDDALIALRDFQQYDIQRVPFRELQKQTFKLAYQHRRSAYDSAYMALAQSENLWLYTGDKKLANAVGNALPWVQWIGNYTLDAVPGIHNNSSDTPAD